MELLGTELCPLPGILNIRKHLLSWVPQKQLTLITGQPMSDLWLVIRSVMVSGHHLGKMTNFSFPSMEMIYRYLQFFCMGHHGSVIC
jgi:hypothetical protein